MGDPRELSYEKCRELLSDSEVGRVALCTDSGPQILPVNYSVVDDSIVFRTAPYGVLGTYAWNTRLAFEVDHIDHERQQGWSVVATGTGTMIEEADELAVIRTLRDPHPWAGGASRLLYVRLPWTGLTGRQVGSG
jgi:nitroimidazol reductase NimA-like FMN-containing flavoprotein (pyridoxamine 5'-phosphate oxidase superfamily)